MRISFNVESDEGIGSLSEIIPVDDPKLHEALQLENLILAHEPSRSVFLERLQRGLPLLLGLCLDETVAGHVGLPTYCDDPFLSKEGMLQFLDSELARRSAAGNGQET
jgi:hypothetical protein